MTNSAQSPLSAEGHVCDDEAQFVRSAWSRTGTAFFYWKGLKIILRRVYCEEVHSELDVLTPW